jgi:hypothetical protein
VSTRGPDTARLLGAAFLIVDVTSITSGIPLMSALGTGDVPDILTNAAANEGAIRVSVLLALLNSAAIVALATLLYAVLAPHGRSLAIAGVGLWLGEAVFYAVAWIGAAGLISVGKDFVAAAPAAQAPYLTLGDFLYNGVYHLSNAVLMFFYCAGGFVFYYLFFASRIIPRWISGFGLIVVALGSVGVLLELLGYGTMMALMIAILPFELLIGFWLLLRGASESVGAGGPERVPAGAA